MKCFAGLLLLAALPAAAATLTAHYPLDETSGTTISDAVGSNHGTATNLTLGQAGLFNSAAQFTETLPSSINLGTAATVEPSGAFSVALWIKPGADGADDNERLLDCSNGDAFSAMNKGFNLKKQNGVARVFFGDGVNKGFTAGPANQTIVTGIWQLVVFRFTPATTPGSSANGTSAITTLPLGTNTITAADVAAKTDTASAHSVGSLAYDRALRVGIPSAPAATAALAYDGLMDDLRFYSGTLTDTEIADLFNAAFTTNPPPPVAVAGALRWHWNATNDLEGWTVAGMTGAKVTNGVFSAISSGSDPQFLSPDNLNLSLTGITNVYLRLRNGSSLTNAKVFFQTTSNATFTGNSVDFTLVASDPGFTTYTVNMTSHSNWNGTLKRLRLDLPDAGDSTGALMELDWVAVGESGTRPNIVFVLADDLGWNDVSINGSTFYQTPNVERLAARGMNFTHAYTANPLCSPTRASILTGLYPGRLRLTTPNGHLAQEILDPIVPATAASTSKLREPQSATRLKNEYLCYSEVLKTAGYSTAFMGKWHLGRDQYIPDNQGFDTVVGGRQHPGPPGGYFAPFSADSNLPSAPAGTHVNDVLASSAGSFIQTNRNKPFLLNLWFYDVHAPFECKSNLRSNYLGQSSADGRQKNPTMGAMVETMDNGLGAVLDKLDALGLRENTIVIFYSDNGGNMYNFADGALPTHNWPLRQGKASIYEGGSHVPLVVDWPGHTAPGSTHTGLVSSVDFFPTILEMTGVPLQTNVTFDGVSLAPALNGGASQRTNAFCHFPHSTPATANFAACWVRSGDWKLIRFFHDEGPPTWNHRYELYDLASDPHEMTNVAAANPALVTQLDTLITNHLTDTAALLPLPNSAYTAPVYPWPPNVQARLSTGGDNRLMVTANGFEPALTCTADLSTLGTPAKLAVVMQSRSFGDGKLFWRLPGQTNFPAAQSVAFPVIHDDTLRTNTILFSPGGPVAQLRLQPSSDSAVTEIASIQMLDAGNNVLRTWLWPEPDNDGDGHSDTRELAENRDPESAADLGFEFDTDGDFDGWSGSQNIADAEVSFGTWNGTSATADPYLYNVGFNFSASAVPKVALRLKAAAAGTVQFYFATTATNTFSSAQLINLNYTNPPNWQTLVFDAASHGGWAGKTVTKMRFDPINVSNADFAIDWIRASNGSPNDRLNFKLNSPPASTNVQMDFYGGAGVTYHVQSATNLPAGPWTNLTTFGPLSISGVQNYDYDRSSDPARERYFRIHIQP